MALHTSSIRSTCLNLETLENRVLLSHAIAHVDEHHDEHEEHNHAAETATCEYAKSANAVGSGYRLDLVVLHELGHSLGIGHSSDRGSIMYAYYNANYNISNFSSDSIVATLQSMYANVTTSPWKDSLDSNPGNGKVDLTFSYMPDGAKAEQNKTSTLFSSLDSLMSRSTWQGIFSSQFNRWAQVSGNKIGFSAHSDNGAAFNFSGSKQNDPRVGDIRLGAHRMDGANKTLAHTYLPGNSGTGAGDLHLDNAEGWTASAGTAMAPTSDSTTTTKDAKISQRLIVGVAMDADEVLDFDRDAVEPILI